MTAKVLVDVRGAQVRADAISRYTLNLVGAMIERQEVNGVEIHLLLEGTGATTVPAMQRRFAALQEKGRIHVIPGLSRSQGSGNDPWCRGVEIALGAAAIRGLAPDAVLCPGPFGDDAPPQSGIPTVAILHDPAEAHKLAACDRIVASSAVARDAVIDRGRVPPDHIAVVPGDAGPTEAFPDPSIVEMVALRQRLDLHRPYALASGADAGTFEAYAALPAALRASIDLVIPGHPPEDEADANRHAPGRIRWLNTVPETDLSLLLALAKFVILPTSSTCGGLPALEAIRCGTPVIGPAGSGAVEALATEDAMFEASDPKAPAALMRRILTDPAFAADLIATQRARAPAPGRAQSADATLTVVREVAHPPARVELDAIEDDLIAAIRAIPGVPTESDLDRAAVAVDNLRGMLRRASRPRVLPASMTWRLEGPFDSSYSLALVNRETALALDGLGVEVALVSAEGPGAYDPDPAIFQQVPDLVALDARNGAGAFVTSRNMFPPRVHDIESCVALMHGYAWEETGLPPAYLRDFGSYLDGLLVTSDHVRKVLIDQGLDLPVHVVGNGVDHLDRIAPAALPCPLWPETAAFRLLHVSSGFPRKAPEALLQAYAAAFDGARDVALVIKSHPNPHNDFAERITRLQAAHPDLPPIRLVEDEMTPGQMRSLYAQADCLVVPSRAEGFCLPLAEAVLSGTPVVTTGWSGQTTFAGNPLVTFCDYSFAEAESHLRAWDSVWAEPDVTDLAEKLRAVRAAGSPEAETARLAADDLRTRFNWTGVARRSVDALTDIVEGPRPVPARIGWISTFNARCGIATYSKHLIDHLPDRVTVFAAHTVDRPTPDDDRILRCWTEGGQDDLTALDAAVQAADPEILVIQFNFGFFSVPCLEEFVRDRKAEGRTVIFMMHATDDAGVSPTRRLSRLAATLHMADRILVHSVHDLNRMKGLGLVETVALFPHGVPQADVTDRPLPDPGGRFTLATYGFMLPQKGFPELIEAVALLRKAGRDIKLKMINADYPVVESRRTRAAVEGRIAAEGLDDHVELTSAFLPDPESFARLAEADLLIFPYRATQESASGAIRQALAVGRPIAATPFPIFDDVASLINHLPGDSPADMARGIADIADALAAGQPDHPVLLRRARSRDWCDAHAYKTLAPRLWRQIQTVHRDACRARRSSA